MQYFLKFSIEPLECWLENSGKITNNNKNAGKITNFFNT